MKKHIVLWSDITKTPNLSLAGAGGRRIPMRSEFKIDAPLPVGKRKSSAINIEEKHSAGRLNGYWGRLLTRSLSITVPKVVLVFAAMVVLAGMWFLAFGITSEPNIYNTSVNLGQAEAALQGDGSGHLAKLRRFKQGSEQTIKSNEYRIVAFRRKMEEGGPRFKARHAYALTALEVKNRGLKKELDGYHDDGEVKWEIFRTNFNDDLDGVGKSMTALFNDK